MKLDYALLGLVNIAPGSSGYQLKSMIDQSTGFFFNAHYSQIYPSLKRLTEKKWVEYETVPKSGRLDEKRYTLTDDGLVALNAWLTEPYDFKLSRTSLDGFFLKLILMGHLKPQQISSCIDQGLRFIEKELAQLEDRGLEYEFSILQNPRNAERLRYKRIWLSEFEFIKKELQDRIAQLRTLKGELGKS